MKDRCFRPASKDFCLYGGRGIRVCQEWVDSFFVFKKWAIENGYSDDLTIDRIDSNGNYEPLNCRWTTTKVQANNKRNSRFFEINGVSKTASQWADFYGLPYEKTRTILRYNNPNMAAKKLSNS